MIAARVIIPRVIRLVKIKVGIMAYPVFSTTSRELSKDEVRVSWEKRKTSPVDKIIPEINIRQNLMINLN